MKNKKNKLVGVGAGGHAKVMIEIIRQIGGYDLIGLLEKNKKLWGATVSGVPVLGGDDLLRKIYKEGIHQVFIGVGSVGDATLRKKLYLTVHEAGFKIINVIHPKAIVSPSVKLGKGFIMMAGAIANADTQFGNNVIVNTGAIVEHGCVIGDHVHIASGARLASTVHVGEGSHIGLGASIKQSVRIGKNVVVGAGAVVIEDVPSCVVVAGVPARVITKREKAR